MPRKTTPLFRVYSGDALETLTYRIIQRCPPTVSDFLSYEALGRHYDRRDFFKGTGVSMHSSKERSIRTAQTYGVGAAIAELDLRHPSVVWARTGGPDHLTVCARRGSPRTRD